MSTQLLGIAAGLGAGALWGLTFVAPLAVKPYTEADLAVLRYGAFGLTSLVLMALSARFRPGPLTSNRIGHALWLGLSGYVLYFLCAAASITLAGPAIAPLIIGALPITLAIYGNWTDKTVTWAKLAPSLMLVAIGLALVNVDTFTRLPTGLERQRMLLGLLAACGAHLIWFLYAIGNARAMRGVDAPSTLGWTSLQGLGAMAGCLPLIVVAPLTGHSLLAEVGFRHAAAPTLVVWALVTGIIASWIAQLLWTHASRTLPMALSAQLIVAETVFALLYGFGWLGRWPTVFEVAGCVLLGAGVFLSVRRLS